MPLTSEIQDAILWPSFIFIFQSCCLSPMHVVNLVDQWTRSNSAQISNVSLAVICTNWPHLTPSCSLTRPSWFFWAHDHMPLGGLPGLGIQPNATSQNCLCTRMAPTKILKIS